MPSVAVSFGQAFFSNDPRIGAGTAQGSPVSVAHALQLVASKRIAGTDFRITLARVTQEQSLAKIDPDTGLQFNEGTSPNRYITLSARHYFNGGILQASFSKADARNPAPANACRSAGVQGPSGRQSGTYRLADA